MRYRILTLSPPSGLIGRTVLLDTSAAIVWIGTVPTGQARTVNRHCVKRNYCTYYGYQYLPSLFHHFSPSQIKRSRANSVSLVLAHLIYSLAWNWSALSVAVPLTRNKHRQRCQILRTTGQRCQIWARILRWVSVERRDAHQSP